jgi:hypothetical protein
VVVRESVTTAVVVGESVTTAVVVGESGAAESLISRALYWGVRCDGSGSHRGVRHNGSGSWGVAVAVGESDATAVVVRELGAGWQPRDLY